jgi:hypothetical protein
MSRIANIDKPSNHLESMESEKWITMFFMFPSLDTNGCDKFKNVMQTLEKMHRSLFFYVYICKGNNLKLKQSIYEH